MNKADIIDVVAVKLGHSKRDVTNIVEAVIEETKRAVAKGERVALSGFGVFEAQARKARLGRNPRTGETVKIKATKLPKFRAGAEFKAVVNGTKKVAATPAKKAAAKKPAAKKAAAKKPVAKKAAAKKPAAKKAVKKAVKKTGRR